MSGIVLLPVWASFCGGLCRLYRLLLVTILWGLKFTVGVAVASHFRRLWL